jgi:hypothetical protein
MQRWLEQRRSQYAEMAGAAQNLMIRANPPAGEEESPIAGLEILTIDCKTVPTLRSWISAALRQDRKT